MTRINQQTLRKRGFIDPLQLTIAVFEEVNRNFLEAFSSNGEYEINMLMFRRIFEEMLATLDKIEDDQE